ncbi:MAG: TolC family protein, partial [Verrucomicrobiota bacterium]
MFLIPGCETYDPQFLDPAAHRTEWSERDATRESVEAFAERVGKSPSQDRSFDARDGLTLPEGQVVALIFNPDLRVARLRAGVARATAEHAGLWEDPVLSVDVLNVTQSVPDPWVIGSALAFTIPVSGRLEVEKARAEAEMHAELERVSEAEWEVIRDVAHDWLEWSAEGYKLEETRTILGELNSVVASTSRLVEAGELLRTEAALFSIEQASRRAERDRLSAAVEENEPKLR